jgi:hypothetical protein
MSYVIADPEMMTAAAADLATIGSNVNAAHMVAAARTTSVIPAAADEVSASIAHLFSQHAASYQALAGQAAAFQDQFVQHLTAGAFSYAGIEAKLAALLQDANGVAANIVGTLAFLASLPPQEQIAVALALLTSPIWLPVVGIGLLVFFYWLSTHPLIIGMYEGFLTINGMVAF